MADFLEFVMTPSREAFLAARSTVVNHEQYDPYSEDISTITELLNSGKFDEVIAHNNINTLLSPRAHIYKRIALEEKGIHDDAKSEMIFAQRILENIALTGNGTAGAPYIVTRVEDERDFLTYIEEKLTAQSLSQNGGRYYDVIQTESGKTIYFDITDSYLRMQQLYKPADLLAKVQGPKPKPWWKFW